jgi:hypothetical protein
MNNKPIIIYRSKAEQMQDEFMFNLMQDHPNLAMYVFGVILLFIISIFAYVIYSHITFSRKWKR